MVLVAGAAGGMGSMGGLMGDMAEMDSIQHIWQCHFLRRRRRWRWLRQTGAGGLGGKVEVGVWNCCFVATSGAANTGGGGGGGYSVGAANDLSWGEGGSGIVIVRYKSATCDDQSCATDYYHDGSDCAACPTGSNRLPDTANQCLCPENYYRRVDTRRVLVRRVRSGYHQTRG